MDGYKLFRRVVVWRFFILKSVLMLKSLGLGMVECLWIGIRGKACRGDILVGVCYMII